MSEAKNMDGVCFVCKAKGRMTNFCRTTFLDEKRKFRVCVKLCNFCKAQVENVKDWDEVGEEETINNNSYEKINEVLGEN